TAVRQQGSGRRWNHRAGSRRPRRRADRGRPVVPRGRSAAAGRSAMARRSLPYRRQLALQRADVGLGARDVFLQALDAIEVLLVIALAAESIGFAILVLGAQGIEPGLLAGQFGL